MCRIYGHLNGNVTTDRLALLPALLRHGGPDGDYQQAGLGWAVGSTRLAVLDPRGGRQPYDLDDRIKVV
ncbi:MAG: asparagine synthase (glutamine-hydrolyzing), partial [Pseudonocardiaceae bacterium]